MNRLASSLLLGLSGTLLLAAAPQQARPPAPSQGPVKAGVDAWSAGDYARAVAAWRAPAERGDADAQFNLAQAYKLGRGVPADPAQAEQWYGKAAAQGHLQAEDNYALTLFQNGKRADAAPWLERSAARGEPRAQLVLGTMLFNGDGGVGKDWPRAYALMTRASGSGLPQATQTLAEMDKFIPEDQRRRGLELARQYETQAQRPQLPPEVAANAPRPAAGPPPIRTTPVPPSRPQAPLPDRPGTSYPAPGTRPAPPPAASPAAPPPPAPARPAPSPAPAATAAPAPSGRWRIQLGAFRDEGNARALWERLKPRVEMLGNRQSYLVHAGALTRLQAGPFASSSEANRACAAVKAKNNGCVPVAP